MSDIDGGFVALKRFRTKVDDHIMGSKETRGELRVSYTQRAAVLDLSNAQRSATAQMRKDTSIGLLRSGISSTLPGRIQKKCLSS